MDDLKLSYDDKATIYLIPDLGMGYHKIEVRSLEVWSQEYAQYKNAAIVQFTRKGKQKSETILQAHQPSLVAFEGWNLPDLQEPFEEPESKDGLVIRRQRHTSFSDNWQKEFDEFYEKHLSGFNEIIDLRPYKVQGKEAKSTVTSDIDTINNDSAIAEEVIDSDDIFEGAKKRIVVNSYERDSKARQICINKYGTACFVCGIVLSEKYGSIAEDYIHVHHLLPISKIGKTYKLDPIKDLRPVCPSCHSIIHLKDPPLTIEDAKKLLM